MRSIVSALLARPRWQRIAVIALGSIPLVLVTICCAPALVILPFFSSGADRAHRIVEQLIKWTRTILNGSHEHPAIRRRGPTRRG